jgi:hypothetical protein
MQTCFMENQTERGALGRTRAGVKLALALSAAVLLAGCAGGPPTPPPPQDPAEVKAETKAREDFARDLPKPPER